MSVRTTKYGIECDQNWEDLETKDCGKFCETCNKPVMDFLNWDRDTVVRYMQLHPKTCGRFSIDHFEQGLKSRAPYFNSRTLLFGALSVWGLSTGSAMNVKEKTATIQIVPETVPPSVFKPTKTSFSDEKIFNPSPTADSTKLKHYKVKWYKRRHFLNRRTYISWRFPFIHRQRQGHLLGCINF